MEEQRQLHQFVVPTYGRSPYLRECLTSLRSQKTSSPILITTSTPFSGIDAIASEFDAEVHIHYPNKGIAHDWNVGLNKASADWVTIAHQDDIYLPDYSARILESIEFHSDALLLFSDYAEILTNGSVRRNTSLLKLKKALLAFGFLGRQSINDRWSKVNLLRFGSPIPCPSVTLRNNQFRPKFESGFRLNMDWAAWLHLAHKPGKFVRINSELMYHRIHDQSETTDGIVAGYRRDEDLAILYRLWPRPIARLIARTYGIAYRSNAQ